MSDPTNKGPGDCSHILENLPPTSVHKEPMPVPVGVRDVTPEGEVLHDPAPDAPAAGVLPGELVRVVSPQEAADAIKCHVEPCMSCKFFSWPTDPSDIRHIEAYCSSLISGLPEWQRPYVPYSNPKGWGSCDNAGQHNMTPVDWSCGHYRSRRGH